MDIDVTIAEAEHFFHAGASLVTVMDMNGVVTYANQEFIDASGFSHQELIGASLEAIWHPDMPKICGVNLLLTMKCDKLYCGIVKNRCKNGSFFWTESIATPLKENDQTVGYIALHNVPTRAQVNDAETLYQKIRAGENQNNRRILDFYNAAHERINQPVEARV